MLTTDVFFNPQWDRVEKGDVQERKIRVSFLPAEDPDAVAPTVTPARQTATNGVSRVFTLISTF